MQKILKLTSLLLIIILLVSTASFAATDTISLYIDGKKLTTDVAPEIRNGRTLVPVRVIFEQFDANVYWNDTIKQVTVATDDKTIILTINSNTAVVNSKRHILDCAPIIKEGRTLIPVRFISESLGYTVDWDDKTRSVKISSKKTSTDKTTDTTTDKKEEPMIKYKIENISVIKSDTQDTTTIRTNCETSPSMMVLADPFRIVLDFDNTKLENGDGKITVNSGFIKEIRFAKHDASSRVVIECKSSQPYNASFKSGTVTVKTGSKDTYVRDEEKDAFTTEDTSSKDDTKPTDKNPPSDTETSKDNTTDEEIPEEEIDPLADLKFLAGRDETNLLVIVDAGHGGSDPGALGYDAEGNIILKEKDVNLAIANKVAKLLRDKGIAYAQTRSEDKYLTLQEITDFANSNDGDLFVSIHSNAVENPSISGTMVLYNGDIQSRHGIEGKEIASNIKKEIIKNISITDKGIVSRPGLWVLRQTIMPSALVECAFVTNENDRKLLMDDSVLDLFADAIVKGIEKSLETMKKSILSAREELKLKENQ